MLQKMNKISFYLSLNTKFFQLIKMHPISYFIIRQRLLMN
jgi:hypothetical protein